MQASLFVAAARRTADGSPEAAWQALLGAAAPADIAQGKAPGVAHLQGCRDAVNAEIGRCARMPPKFSADGVHVCLRVLNASRLGSWVGPQSDTGT